MKRFNGRSSKAEIDMRVVFDSNVLVSAFLWQKSLKPVYDWIRSSALTPCFSDETLGELKRVLRYVKFERQLKLMGVTPEEIERLLLSRSYFVPVQERVEIIQDDPSDNHILACALAARASCIVSGDRHLLKLKSFRGIPILTPRQFLKGVK